VGTGGRAVPRDDPSGIQSVAFADILRKPRLHVLQQITGSVAEELADHGLREFENNYFAVAGFTK
jgi:hypothetical protein